MSSQTTLLEIVHRAIEEVSRPLAKPSVNFGLLVARYLQADPFNYVTSVSTMGDGVFRLFVDEFKGMDWFVDMTITSTFSYTTDGPHECARAMTEEDSVVGPVIDETLPVVPEQNEITKAFDTLKVAMASDPSYLWSWVCNTACPIMDSGIEHGKANIAAARVLAHLFQVDVTEMPEYKDIIARTSKEPAPIEDMDAADPDVNTVHVTVTGFDSNSGAEALSRYIHDLLASVGQYNTKLNIADTTLSEGDRSLGLPKKTNTLIIVTGVESRYHTDRVSSLVDLEDDEVALADEGVDLDDCGVFGEGEDPDCGADAGPFDTVREAKGKMTINLKVDDTDTSPLCTIGYFRSAYPEADLNVDIKPDHYLTDEIAKTARIAEEKKTIHITLGKEIENPEEVISAIQKAVLDNVDELPTLSNPKYRKNAYVFEKDSGDDKAIMVLHVEVDADEFHPELFVGNGVRIVNMPNIAAMRSLLEAVGNVTATEHYVDLFCNNERWLNRFGDGTEVTLREHEGPFTLFNISQDSIPKMIYGDVEDAWKAFQNIDRLPELARVLEDPTIVIPAEDFIKVTRSAMVLREHPRLEELFLKFLKYKSNFDPCIGRWLRSYGK
jgi:hypothetical protein